MPPLNAFFHQIFSSSFEQKSLSLHLSHKCELNQSLKMNRTALFLELPMLLFKHWQPYYIDMDKGVVKN